MEEFFKFCRYLEVNNCIKAKHSILNLFEELFEICDFRRGLLIAFNVLESQIDKPGLHLDSNIDMFFLIRPCKNLVKQLNNSGLKEELPLKTRIKTLLTRIIPLCHRSGLNVSGRFCGAPGSNLPLDARKPFSWIEETDKLDLDKQSVDFKIF